MRTLEYACPHPPFRPMSKWSVMTLLLCAAVLLPACESMAPARTATAPATHEPVTMIFRPDHEYFSYMRTLAVAGPAAQKTLYQQAAADYRKQPGPHTRLRLALALSLLAAPYDDAAKARQLFKELLSPAQPQPLTLGLESIVQAQINEINHRLVLEERLALLQQELDKAQAKIQALTTIERTLEQPIPETKSKVAP